VTARILIIDDEPGIRGALKQVLEFEDHEVRTAASGGEGLSLYGDFRPHVVFLDVKMAGLDGLDTLQRLRSIDPEAIVVMISGHGTVQTAVEATRKGAFDFLEKPLDTDRLLVTVRNALERTQLVVENIQLKAFVGDRYQMVGASVALERVKEMVRKVGPTPARVLILGENGAGKELVAHGIHAASPRAGRPFIEVNCAAIPSELIESELFGHMKGSFTGAFADHTGKFEQAHGGTLFLDEIGDLALAAQAKLLRALQEGIITRVGGTKAISVDVRVIAATNKDLRAEIEAGHFREDLLYRLNVVEIRVPPLRERRDDIPTLVAHFADRLLAAGGLPPRIFEEETIRLLQRRSWPGNVRELRNSVERLLILSDERSIGTAEVRTLLSDDEEADGAFDPTTADSFRAFKDEAERQFLMARLREHDWNVSETARALEMPRSNLYKKIERFKLERDL
jgi:two-component system nitrogen regulation response regulator NtrX